MLAVFLINYTESQDFDSDDYSCTINDFHQGMNITCTENITTLHFTNTAFSTIPSFVFEIFSMLTYLEVSSTHLSSISSTPFGAMHNINNIDLSNNSLITIPNHTFDKCHSLIELNFSCNEISELPENAFAGLSNLTVLDLSNNSIGALIEGLFYPLVQLHQLRLESNRIKVIDNTLFTKNQKLQMLYLDFNRIAVVSPEAFRPLRELITISIGHNPITRIDFSHMNKIRTIIVNNANLTTLEIPACVHEVTAYQNKISHIKVAPNSNLTSLHIANNRLRNLSDLSTLAQLNALDLTSNNIVHINFTDLANMKKLQQLMLNDNQIIDLDVDGIVNNLPALVILEITTTNYTSNQLQNIANKLSTHKIYLMSEESKIINTQELDANTSIKRISSIARTIVSSTTEMPFGITSNTGTITSKSEGSNMELDARIHRLEMILNSLNANSTDLKNIEKHLRNLRIMTVLVICAFILFLSFQVLMFVRRNYSHIRFQTNTILTNGRARSHESINPILEEVL